MVLLDFANGAMATIDTFFCIPDASSKNRLELYGSEGSILAQGTIGQGEVGEMLAFVQESGAGYNAHQERNAAGGVILSPPRSICIAPRLKNLVKPFSKNAHL